MSQSNTQQGVKPINSDESLVGKEGFLVERTSTGVQLTDADTDYVYGVVIEGAAISTKSDILVLHPGLNFRAKVTGAITEGADCAPHTDGTIKTAASGDRVCAVCEEAAVAGQLGLFTGKVLGGTA